MTVKVTRDAINLREKLSELDKPAGIAGTEILRADTPQEVFNYINAGRRNLIINGAMQVWQRGTSFSGTNLYNADRWRIDSADSSEQAADAPDDFEYSLKVNPTSSNNAVIRQAIELPAAGKGGIFRSGQTFTLSFWIKSDNAGEAISIFIASSTGVAGTTTIHVNDTSTGLTTNTTWTKYTYTYTQASNVGGSDTCYNIVPYVYQPSGAVYFTGVQLEVGSVATPFEHRSYGEELALCQRYYQQLYYAWEGTTGYGSTGSFTPNPLSFNTAMRASPSATHSNVIKSAGVSLHSHQYPTLSGARTLLEIPAGYQYYLATITFDAEL